MAIISVKSLLEAGVHFGHRVSRWNPKMAPYIFAKRNLIHIINLKETVKGLIQAYYFLKKLTADGQEVLFVGTKRQAKPVIQREAQRCSMHYVIERWLGGTLTNFTTIRKRLSRLEELENMEKGGTLDSLSKKMASSLKREQKKINRNLEGIRKMNALPGAIVIIDPQKEHIVVKEAVKLNIPTICLMDTDSDPDLVDIPIPGNDDAMRSIEVICTKLTNAILEGRAEYQEKKKIKERQNEISNQHDGRMDAKHSSMSELGEDEKADYKKGDRKARFDEKGGKILKRFKSDGTPITPKREFSRGRGRFDKESFDKDKPRDDRPRDDRPRDDRPRDDRPRPNNQFRDNRYSRYPRDNRPNDRPRDDRPRDDRPRDDRPRDDRPRDDRPRDDRPRDDRPRDDKPRDDRPRDDRPRDDRPRDDRPRDDRGRNFRDRAGRNFQERGRNFPNRGRDFNRKPTAPVEGKTEQPAEKIEKKEQAPEVKSAEVKVLEQQVQTPPIQEVKEQKAQPNQESTPKNSTN